MSIVNNLSDSRFFSLYWDEVDKLSDNGKLELISRLTDSLKKKKTSEKPTTEEFLAKVSGKWKDSRSDEEIFADFRR